MATEMLIAQLTHRIQMDTIDALVAKFAERWDFAEDDLQMIEEFKASLTVAIPKKSKGKKAKDPEAKKRDPSPYNMFVSEKWQELTDAGFTGKERIREAARRWNAIKEAEAAKAAGGETETEEEIEGDSE